MTIGAFIFASGWSGQAGGVYEHTKKIPVFKNVVIYVHGRLIPRPDNALTCGKTYTRILPFSVVFSRNAPK